MECVDHSLVSGWSRYCVQGTTTVVLRLALNMNLVWLTHSAVHEQVFPNQG